MKRNHSLKPIATAVFTLITLSVVSLCPKYLGGGVTLKTVNLYLMRTVLLGLPVTDEVLAAPGLVAKDRWTPSDDLLVKWIQNPQEAAESGDKYIKSIVERYVGTYGWMYLPYGPVNAMRSRTFLLWCKTHQTWIMQQW